MAANCPIPEATAGSRRTAARVTRGAISLSSSSHFPLMPYSKIVNPVALPPGRARLVDEAGAHRVDDQHEHDRHDAGRLQQRRHGYGASTGQDDVRCERDQFRRVSANVVGIGRWPSGCRSAHCGHRSSPIAAGPAGTPRGGPAIPDRPRLTAMSTPIRRTRSGSCARTPSGHATAAPPSPAMNSLRRTSPLTDQAEAS